MLWTGQEHAFTRVSSERYNSRLRHSLRQAQSEVLEGEKELRAQSVEMDALHALLNRKEGDLSRIQDRMRDQQEELDTLRKEFIQQQVVDAEKVS